MREFDSVWNKLAKSTKSLISRSDRAHTENMSSINLFQRIGFCRLVPMFRLKIQSSSGESDKDLLKKGHSHTMQIGKSELHVHVHLKIMRQMHAILIVQWIPTSVNFSCFKIHLLRQFVLVRKIFEDSQEMVWPGCKQCSAKADLCECLFTTATSFCKIPLPFYISDPEKGAPFRRSLIYRPLLRVPP